MKQRSGFVALSLVLLLALGCRGPTLQIDCEEPATLYLDGVTSGPAPLATPVPYYGTLIGTAVPETTPMQPRRESTQRLEVAPPAPLWLFPLDFLVEVVDVTFSGIPDHSFTLPSAPASPAIPEGLPPPRAPELLARAAAAARAR